MNFPAKWLPKKAFAFLEKIKDHRFLVYGGLVRDYIRSQLGDETAPSGDEVAQESDVDVLFLHDNFDEAVDFLSRHTKALFPALIKERTIRVVVGDDESVDVAIVPTSVDLTRYPFDFTVNTFYCDGQTLVEDGSAPIYSPFKMSWQDVQQKVLRAPNPRWLVDYPFGAIRGLRLYCQLPVYRFEKATAGIYPKALQKARWDISPLLIVREFARAVDYSLRRFAEALYVTRGDEVFFDPLQKLLRGAESQHLFLAYSAFDDSLRTDKYGKRWAKFCAKAKEVLVNVRMGVSRYRNLLNMTGFALLLHDIGKAIKEDSHDILGARLVGKITEQLSFFPNERWIIYWLVRYHMRVHEAAHGDEKAIQWLKRKRDVLRYAAILLAASDALGHPESSSPEEVTTRFLDLASAVI
jgi:hypothetical protein